MRAFWELTYVPVEVYRTAVGGAHVLRSVKAGDVGEDPEVVGEYLRWACRAGLDLPVIRGLAEKCGKAWHRRCGRAGGHGRSHRRARSLGQRVRRSDWSGLFDLCSQVGSRRDDRSFGGEVWGGSERGGWSPPGGLPSTMQRLDGRVRTVKHLVEKHNVDIHKRDPNGVWEWVHCPPRRPDCFGLHSRGAWQDGVRRRTSAGTAVHERGDPLEE